MRILIISPLFPPRADAEAFCSGKFVQSLMASGVAPTVITCSNVRESPRVDTSQVWNNLKSVSFDLPYKFRPSVTRRLWLGLLYQTSAWTAWTEAAVSLALQLHRERPFDLVVSRSKPEHAHWAGYWVASTLQLPWIANFNDPIDYSALVSTDALPKQRTPNLNSRLWWRRVVARAHALTFPCERLRNYCLKGLRRQSGVFVVPHISGGTASSRPPKEFLIVHTGKLGVHEPGRSAVALLDGVAGLLQRRPQAKLLTRLLFVGPDSVDTTKHASIRGLSENVAGIGPVSYDESLDHIAKAAIGVLVEADFPEGIFLPSKLSDYIGARKPVLALSPDVGTVNDLAQEGGIRRVRPTDAVGVADALVEFFDAFLASRLESYVPPDSLVQRFEGKRVIEDFLRIAKWLSTGSCASGEPTFAT